jgi:hypothetical protein
LTKVSAVLSASGVGISPRSALRGLLIPRDLGLVDALSGAAWATEPLIDN